MNKKKEKSFAKTVIKVQYKDEWISETEKSCNVVEFDYDSFIKYMTNSPREEIEKIATLHIYPNGDDSAKFLCGDAQMWKKHDSKRLFERYYTLSEMQRTLYANEVEADGSPVNIYINIDEKRYIVNWTAELKEPPKVTDKPVTEVSDMFNDIFTYRNATVEEIGLLNFLGDIYPKRPNDVYDIDMNRLIHTLAFIQLYDENVTLKQCKIIYQRMAHHGFAQQNIQFNVEM